MIGTLINAGLIVAGSLLGLLLRRGIPERTRTAVMKAMGLAVILIGLSGALKTADTLCVIVCLAVGGVAGSLVDLEKRLDSLGKAVERRLGGLAGSGDSLSKGFVTASLVYCVGAMAIVGAIDSGVRGDHTTLIAKGIIDGITAIVFTSTLGIGVAFSAAAVFVYQGAIALLAGVISPALTQPVITEMGAVGGLLIAAIGFNMLYEKERIPVGNLLPAIFLPMAYVPLAALFG